MVLEVRPDIFEWASKVSAIGFPVSGTLLLAAMAPWEFLPEESRLRLVKDISDHSIQSLDAKPLKDEILQPLFKGAEFTDYAERFRKEWLSDPASVFSDLGRFSSDDEAGMYTDFRENLRIAQRYFEIDDDDEAFAELYAELDAHIEELEAKASSPAGSAWSPPPSGGSDTSSAAADTIFYDVDD
ncbi:hypothetical protein [Bradyrhizobium neotropicale]|nr:hypothetical protein [Bradyrhizobium neotropicale]